MSMCLSSSRSLVALDRGLGGIALAAPWWRSLVGSALSAGACRWRLRASGRAFSGAVLVAGFGCPAAAARFAAAWASWCGCSLAVRRFRGRGGPVWGVSVPVSVPPGSPSLGAPLSAALPAPVWVARGEVGALPIPRGVVAVAGSRRLPPEASALVAQVARELVAGGCSLVVGCCVGADAAVLAPIPGALGAALPGRAVRVLSAFGPGGAGAGPASAVRAVLAAEASGVPVAWWSGGGPSVPLVARLARRTRAVVVEASAGLVLFPALAMVVSSGSWLAAAAAVGRRLPVVVFPIGFAADLLPQLGVGRWVPVDGAGVWDSAWRWVSDQVGLF